MFNIFKSVKKLVGSGKDLGKDQDQSTEDKNILSEKIGKLSNLFDDGLNYVVSEYTSIKEKSKDLSATNLNLGMKYLEEGNINEAIFRFKITKKFWPDNYEAWYQLIICLILKEKFEEAEKLMRELSEKSPEYKAKIEEKFGTTYNTESNTENASSNTENASSKQNSATN